MIQKLTFSLISIAGLTASMAAPLSFAQENNSIDSNLDARDGQIQRDLEAFDSNPVEFMNSIPRKNAGNSSPALRFSLESISDGSFVEVRDQSRKNMCSEVNGTQICLNEIEAGRAPIMTGDEVEDLMPGVDLVRNLADMEKSKLQSAKLAINPWSDTYWPIYKGILGWRYADSQFPGSHDFKTNSDFVAANPASKVYASGNASNLDNLSPSEKYDILVGDMNFTLTKAMWAEGQGYFDQYGKVESWMGVCHGWAPAAFLLPRPSKTVEVTAADGKTKLTFYPSDIKALGTLLHANGSLPSVFSGGRCSDKDPAKDPTTGRITSQKCFDTNPGTWHMAVVNQIAIQKRSFVIDATYDYEVWNQPVQSYSYTYFNPQTNKPVKTLKDGMIPIESFSKDKFKKFRSPQAKYVVGVSMNLAYIVETNPNHNRTDAASYDGVNDVDYLYDLELDADGNIIGGEWYQNAHPDFLWGVPPGASVSSYGDVYIRKPWDGVTPVPSTYTRVAVKTSGAGQPLSAIVNTLFGLSSK